jgi:hypothetical protein
MLKEGAGNVAEKLLENQNVKILKGARWGRRGSGPSLWQMGTTYLEMFSFRPLGLSPTVVVFRRGFCPTMAGFRSTFSSASRTPQLVEVTSNSQFYVTTQPGWLAMKVADQVPVLISNLKADFLGNGKQLTYSPKQKMAMPVPVGQASGTGEMFGWVPLGKMIIMIKGKDFFVSRARGFISAKYSH